MLHLLSFSAHISACLTCVLGLVTFKDSISCSRCVIAIHVSIHTCNTEQSILTSSSINDKINHSYKGRICSWTPSTLINSMNGKTCKPTEKVVHLCQTTPSVGSAVMCFSHLDWAFKSTIKHWALGAFLILMSKSAPGQSGQKSHCHTNITVDVQFSLRHECQ